MSAELHARLVVADLDHRRARGRSRARRLAPRRPPRPGGPSRRGGSRSGNAPSFRIERVGRHEAARAAVEGLQPALHRRGWRRAGWRGRASCRPAGRPGRCAGCRTRARGTCGPPPGSRARWTAGRAGPCRFSGSALAFSASSAEMYFSSTMRVSTWLRRGERALGVLEGGEARRVLGQAGHQRGLAQGQVLDRLAVEEPAGRLDPVVAVAEVHLVAVEGEDLFLGEVLLDLEGEDGLLDLPLVALLRGQEEDRARAAW